MAYTLGVLTIGLMSERPSTPWGVGATYLSTNTAQVFTESGGIWVEVANAGGSGTGVASLPPSGQLQVVNLWVDASTGKLSVEYDDVPGSGSTGVPSDPPSGNLKVTNLWVDVSTGKLSVEYDDVPV